MPYVARRRRTYYKRKRTTRTIQPRKRKSRNYIRRRRRYKKRMTMKRDPVYGSPPDTSPPRRPKNVIVAQSNDLTVRNIGNISVGSPSKIIGKSEGVFHYFNQNQWVMTGTQGFQVVDFPEVLFTNDQLIGNTSNQRGERYQWADDPFTLNPFRARPTSAVYPVAPAGVEGNETLYIKNVRLGYEFLSMTPVPQFVSVYWLMPKYDTEENPIDTWNTILASLYSGQNSSTTSNTVLNPIATPGYSGVNQPGNNPFHFRDFIKQWKCLKVQKIALPPGEQVNLNFNINFEKVMRKSTLLTRETQFLAGLTVFPLVIVRAGLVGLKDEGLPQATEVSYGECKVGVITNQNITFGSLPVTNRDTSRYYGGIVFSTIDEQRVLDDEDAVIDPSANEV